MKGINKNELLFSNKDLWLLIWPLIVEQFLQISLGLADIIMVSHLGEANISGVSLIDQLNILLVQVFAALGTGGAVVCSQYIGRRQHDMAEKTARQLLYAITVSSLVLLVLGLALRKSLLPVIFGRIESDVMDSAQRYFFISLFALPGIALYNGAASLFRAQGNSEISMMTALLVNVLNIGGNAICIYGLKMGVEGVAFPTLISRTAAAVVLLYFLYNAKDYNGRKALSIKGIGNFDIDTHLVWRILKIGIPNGMENSTFQIGKILVLRLITKCGTIAIAANAAANTMASFEVLPGAAIGLAMLTVTGQCLGASKQDQAVYYTKKLMLLTYASMCALNIPLLLSAGGILSLLKLQEETRILALYMTLTHGLFGMLIWPLSFSLPNSLRAAGDSTFTMIVSIISMWTIRVGMSFLFWRTGILGMVDHFNLPQSYTALCVWFAMILDWVVRSAFFTARFASGKWKNLHVI